MSAESSSTIGKQRRTNYALLAGSSEEFVHLLTDDLPAAPEYFAQEVGLNRKGAAPISELPTLRAMKAAEVRELQEAGTVAVDTRPAAEFAAAHVPGSVHIALTGQYASWAARILGLNTKLVIVGEDEQHVRESQLRLPRVGLEGIVGYLEGGISGWVRGGLELEAIPQITGMDLADLLARAPEGVTVLDVREPGEFAGGAIGGAVNIPLGKLGGRTAELDPATLVVVHCKGGYRSSIASSLLRRAGFQDIANLIGGFDAWKAAGLGVSRETAP